MARKKISEINYRAFAIDKRKHFARHKPLVTISSMVLISEAL